MRYKCKECGNKSLTIQGLGYLGDTIEVECSSCGINYEVEQDGLGQGGLEMIDAINAETERNEPENKEDLFKNLY